MYVYCIRTTICSEMQSLLLCSKITTQHGTILQQTVFGTTNKKQDFEKERLQKIITTTIFSRQKSLNETKPTREKKPKK